jgi:phosphoribosylamine--glycine ligase
MQAVTEERLAEVEVKWKDDCACCVIAASEGYPVSYEKGYEIDIPDDVMPCVYIAGAAEEDGKLLTSGGRVLGVTAVRPELAEAIDAAYDMLDRIDFANKYYRADIGQRALKAVK